MRAQIQLMLDSTAMLAVPPTQDHSGRLVVTLEKNDRPIPTGNALYLNPPIIC